MFMTLEDQISAEDYAVMHIQNTLVDYQISLAPLSEKHRALTMVVRQM